MIWVLFLGALMALSLLVLVAKVAGAEGVLVAVSLGLGLFALVLIGGGASLALSVGAPFVGWTLLVVLVGLLAFLAWNCYAGLR